MKGINTNPGGEASYTAQGEASRPPSLVVSLSGQFQGPRVLPVAPPLLLSGSSLLPGSAPVVAGKSGRRMDIP